MSNLSNNEQLSRSQQIRQTRVTIANHKRQERAIAKQHREEIKIQQQQMNISRSDLWKYVKRTFPNQMEIRWPAVSTASLAQFINNGGSVQPREAGVDVPERIVTDINVGGVRFSQNNGQQRGANDLWQWVQQQKFRPGQVLSHKGKPYQFQSNSKLFQYIWLQEAYDRDYEDAYFAEEMDMDENDIMFLNQQMFQFGDENCVLGPIVKVLQQKLMVALDAKKMGTVKNLKITINNAQLLRHDVKEGASVQIMQQICDQINCRIVIQNPVTDYQLDIKSTRSVYPSYTFKFLNVSKNHVEFDGKTELYVNMKDGQEPNLLSNDEMSEKLDELKQQNQLFIFKKSFSDCASINQIQQGQNIYTRHDYYMLKEAVKTLNHDQQDLQICVTDPQLQFINNFLAFPDKVKFDTGSFNVWRSSYCQESVDQYHAIPVYDPPGIFDSWGSELNYSHCVYYHKNKKITHIDCKNGYTQHRNIEEKYRRGFPYITDYRVVNDINFCLEYNGLYMVKITWSRNSDKVIKTLLQSNENITNTYYLITPMIQFLVDNGIDVQPLAGMYGKSSRSIDYEDSAFIEYDTKKAYYVQCCQNACDEKSDILQHIFCNDNEFMQSVNQSADRQKYNILKSYDIKGQEVADEYILQTKIDHTRTQYNTSKHVTAFIAQYQQLNVMIQLKKLPYDSILQVSCDDIYYTEYDGHKDDILPIFREKKFDQDIYKVCYTQSQEVYCVNYRTNTDELAIEEIYQDCGELQQEYNQYQLHLGPGGFGKTHLQQNDKGSIGKYYLTLTNQLVDDQKLQYKNTKCLTKDMFKILHGRNQLPSNPSNIIIDEIGLVDPNIQVYIMHYFPHCKIFALGDKLQLQSPFPDTAPVHGKKGNFFDEQLYDKIYSNYTNDYRTSDEALRALKVKIRAWMTDSTPFNEVKMFNLLAIHCNRLKKITREQLKQEYNSNNLLVVSTKAQQKNYNTLLEDHQKFRCKETFTKNDVKYYTGQVFLEKPFDSPKFEQQHGYTCHSLQGQTYRGDKLYITRPVISDHVDFTGYLYTAVSRCISFDQLVFVI